MSVSMNILGELMVRPRLGAHFFRLLTNSLTTASSFGGKTTAQGSHLGADQQFHLRKAALQSAFSTP